MRGTYTRIHINEHLTKTWITPYMLKQCTPGPLPNSWEWPGYEASKNVRVYMYNVYVANTCTWYRIHVHVYLLSSASSFLRIEISFRTRAFADFTTCFSLKENTDIVTYMYSFPCTCTVHSTPAKSPQGRLFLQ